MASIEERTRLLTEAKNGNGYVIRYPGMTLWTQNTDFKPGSKVYATLISKPTAKTVKVEVKSPKGKKVESDNWFVLMRTKMKKRPMSEKERLSIIME